MSNNATLEIFVQRLKKVPDPRSKQGISQPFQTALAIVFLGLLANLSTIAEIERWAKIHLSQLQSFLPLRFYKGQQQVPSDTTLSRILKNSRSPLSKPLSPSLSMLFSRERPLSVRWTAKPPSK